jgi:hypothetical protein
MTSRPLPRPQAQPRPQAGGENAAGQPRGPVTGLRLLLAGPLQAPARPQAGEDSMTGQLRGALTGQVRAWPLAGGEA